MKKFSVKNEEEAMSLTFLLNQNVGVDDDGTGDKNQLLLRASMTVLLLFAKTASCAKLRKK